MTITTSIDYSTLNWVKEEIDETLKQARHTLEEYVENPEEPTQLRFCLTYVHQVYGTLQMVELYGAAMFAEEMEQLIQALLNNAVTQKEDAYEVLMRAILQLPDYLEKIQRGMKDNPIVLMPILNDLRTARGAKLLSESALFAPDINSASPIIIESSSSDLFGVDPKALAKRLRPLYQIGLLGWYRDKDTQNSLRKLGSVLGQLEQVCTREEAIRLWWVALGIVEALLHGGLEANITLKLLLGQVDREIKRLISYGEQELAAKPASELFKNLLYYTAQARPVTERVQTIQQKYNLQTALTSREELESAREALTGPNVHLMETVSAAIGEDLARVKDALDLLLRNEERDVSSLEPQIDVLQKMADTLGMLGMGVPRKVVLEQVGIIQSMISGEMAPEESRLMDIAGALLYVESSLVGMVESSLAEQQRSAEPEPEAIVPEKKEGGLADSEIRQIQNTVLKEISVELAKAKDAFVAFIDAPMDFALLETVPGLFANAHGGMHMVQLDQAAEVLQSAEKYISNELLGKNKRPTGQELDAIADVVSGVEYYLEAVRENRGNREQILDVAYEGLRKLGYGKEEVESSSTAETEDRDSPNPGAEETQELTIDLANFDLGSATSDSTEEEVTGEHIVIAEPDFPDTEETMEFSVSDLELPPEETVEVNPEITAEINPEVTAEFDSEAELSGQALDDITQVTQAFESEPAEAQEAEAKAAIEPDLAIEPEPEPESAAEPQAEQTAPPGRSFREDIDDDILEIFIEEAEEVLETINENLPVWKQNPEDHDTLSVVRRAFHTLKGSGRLVGATDIGEFAWSLENMLNRVLDNSIQAGSTMMGLLDDAAAALPALIEELRSGVSANVDINHFIQRAENEINSGKEEVANQESSALAEASQPSTMPEDAAEEATARAMDPTLYEIFSKESEGHIATVRDYLATCEYQAENCKVNDALIRALHTLHGSARMAGAEDIAEIGGQLEKYAKILDENDDRLGDEGQSLVASGINAIEEMLALINQPGELKTDVGNIIDKIRTLYTVEVNKQEERARQEKEQAKQSARVVEEEFIEDEEFDQEVVEVFLEEGAEILDSSDLIVQRLANEPNNQETITELQRELHTLKGGARMAGIKAIGDLSHAVESLLTAVVEGEMQISPEMVDVMQRTIDRLVQMLDKTRRSEKLEPAQDLLDEIERVHAGEPAAPAAEETAPAEAPEIEEISLEAVETETAETEAASETGEEAQPEEIIIEQAPEELPEAGESADILSFPARETLEPEQVVEPAAETGAPVTEIAAEMEAPEEIPPFEIPETLPSANVEPQARPGIQEQVRVRADLLDSLVNHAGEASIYRSRLEQQIGAFRFNLVEMDQTVMRLKEQLRKLEIETEAQILFRYEQEMEQDESFDPLELDRYSTIQQLSRALMETTSDINSIQNLLENLVRESETLLIQQARVNTDLQEGLMRTRMVAVSGMMPRLQRIVRQTCKELDKQARLNVYGEHGELDRNVLERITSPLEHMLRNAVSHGIESPAERLANGKPEIGTITFRIGRDGSEVVLIIEDDGAGLNLEAIRNKARERGLIDDKSHLTDYDIMQFVLESGLSTAETVTQISGRGVGMDVVNSEIKQLGGSLHIDSAPGKGTRFTIRLPLTLALNHALLVQVGDEQYAIPLSSIEGIVRMSRKDLQNYAEDHQARYQYAGHDYQVQSLGSMLHASTPQYAAGQGLLPVLLVRSGDHRTALQVDGLMGSREIVVKSVGPQLSTLRGVSGATILGDGRVVLILDIGAIIRLSSAMLAVEEEMLASSVEPTEERKITVMVVDDSITVRKVTTRLLERNDMQVITAKDGVDAVSVLQDHVPDIMLLDIEMPRMDGFELATHMRNEARLKEIPIIMITSRTGDKHRRRAEEIGVQRYLGKPYQEHDLLENIESVLKEHYGHA